MKSRSEPGQEPGAPRWAGLAVSEWSALGGRVGSQGKAGVSWVRAMVSAREPAISPKRPRCLLEVRHTITPRCGPGLAADGLWGRPAGTRVWVGAARGARAELLAGLRGCRTLQGPGVHVLLPTFPPANSKPREDLLSSQASSMTSGKKKGPMDSRCGEVRYPSLGHGGRAPLALCLLQEQPLSLVSWP